MSRVLDQMWESDSSLFLQWIREHQERILDFLSFDVESEEGI